MGRAHIIGILVFGLCMAGVTHCAEAEKLRILQVEFLDEGSFDEGADPSLSVDLTQGQCGDPPDQDDEQFFDTVVATTVKNPLAVDLEVTSVRYRIRTELGGRYIRTRPLSPSIGLDVQAKSEGRVISLFLKAHEGTKRAVLSTTALNPNLGVQNLTVIINLRSSIGTRYTLKKRVSMAFGDYDRCA